MIETKQPPPIQSHDPPLHRQLDVTDILHGLSSHGCYVEPKPDQRMIFRHKRLPTVVCLLKGMATMMFILALATAVVGAWHMVATDEPYKGGLFITVGGFVCCLAVIVGALYHGIAAAISIEQMMRHTESRL